MNYWTLIDRQSDPQELKNVYDDPANLEARTALHAELNRLRTELKVPAEDPAGTGAAASPEHRTPGGRKAGAQKR